MTGTQFCSVTILPTAVSGAGWTSADNALAEDGSVATISANRMDGDPAPLVFTFGNKADIPASAVITGLKLGAKWGYSTGAPVPTVGVAEYGLVKEAATYNAASGSGGGVITNTLSWLYNGSEGDLWGTTWTPGDFDAGTLAATILAGDASDDSSTCVVEVDAAALTIFYTLSGGSDMDFYHAAEEAGWQVLFEEALPSLSSAAGLFPAFSNAGNKSKVVNASYVLVTLRGAGITYRGDGNTPTAGANGIDLPIGGPYEFSVTESEGASFQAVQNGGTATGWIQYWGLKGVIG